jgi:hypothetical protein
LLFGLWSSVWIIDLLVVHSSPHPKAPRHPFTPKMFRAMEHTLTPYPSIVFTFGLKVKSIKEFEGAQWVFSHYCNCIVNLMFFHQGDILKSKCNYVATLTLGSQPRQGLARVWAKRGSPGLTSHVCGSVGGVREWTLKLPSEFPFWELESQWTFESSKSNYKGQNSLDSKFIYIIGKLLERRCLKWVHITHLDTSNTSYDQKKGQESNCQIDFQPLKVENRLDFLLRRYVRHTVGKRLTMATTFL